VRGSKSQGNVARLRAAQPLGRKFLMWRRTVKYGVSNFVRNGWLSLAAIAVMTVTLLTVFMAAAATIALNDTVQTTKIEKMNLSLYLRSDTPEEVLTSLTRDLESDPNVAYIQVADKQQNAVDLQQKVDLDDDIRQLIAEGGEDLDDILPLTMGIHVNDVAQIDGIKALVDSEDSPYKAYQDASSYESQFFHGENQKTVQNMTSMANTVQLVGFVLGGVFLFITILVIFNTIRLAIFARRDEIEMEKLIGAERSYVRGPFLIEAELYGIISGVLALAAGYVLVLSFLPAVWTGSSYGGISTSVLNRVMIDFFPAVAAAMVIIGMLIGNLSARLAVKKYLRY
jgi:cell division transport system permease protein